VLNDKGVNFGNINFYKGLFFKEWSQLFMEAAG